MNLLQKIALTALLVAVLQTTAATLQIIATLKGTQK